MTRSHAVSLQTTTTTPAQRTTQLHEDPRQGRARKRRPAEPPAQGPIGTAGSILRTLGTFGTLVASDTTDVADVKAATGARSCSAPPAVPIVASLRLGLASWPGVGLALAADDAHTGGVENSRFDVHEFIEVGELHVPALRDTLTNRLVELDNAAVK